MKLIVLLVVFFASFGTSFSLYGAESKDQYHVEFDGVFESVVSSAEECDFIYDPAEYRSKHFLVSPTRRTIVTYFEHAEGLGLFHAVRFMSNFGYNNDFIYSETVERDLLKYRINAEGFINSNVVFIEFKTTLFDESGEKLCFATATYSGFN